METPSVTQFSDTFDEDFTLSSFRSNFNVALSSKSILVTILTRGASQILVAFNEGSAATVAITDSNQVISVTSTHFDYQAAEMVEKYYLIRRESTSAGILSIICHEPLGTISNTVVNIKAVDFPIGSDCRHDCGQGICQNGFCSCSDGYFGKACSKSIRLMDKE